MTQSDTDDAPWSDCSGQLREFGASLRRQRRRRPTQKVIGISLAAATAILAAGLLYPPGKEAPATALKCHEVIPMLASFDAGTLPDDLRRQVDAHLNICSHCRDELKKLRAVRTSEVVGDLAGRLATRVKNRGPVVANHLVGVRSLCTTPRIYQGSAERLRSWTHNPLR